MGRVEADLCIIGAGSGGLSVAAGAAQMGARVVLVESGRMGGDCLNTGCVPSKSLIAAAARAEAMRRAGGFGIAPVEPAIDVAAVRAHVAGVIAAIAPHDSVERFEGLGVRVIRAHGAFTGPDRVEAGGEEIRARWFVLATGSAPAVPEIPGLRGVPFLTTDTLWDLADLPRHLVILGAGPVGLELAQAHRRLGAAVTVIEPQRALGREDAEAAALVLARLRAEGIAIREGVAATAIAALPGGGVRVETADGPVEGSHLLLAAGRAPRLAGLGLEAAGIAAGPRGIEVDRGLRTTNRRVFAIGDAAGGPAFTHVAGYHAGLVIRRALFRLPAPVRTDHLPRVTFTDPELAQVGLTEAEARARHGDRVEVARAELSGNDRARAMRATEGFVKVMVHRGRPVGATLVGAEAGETVQVWALALSAGLRIGAVAGMVAPYPTLGETGKRAAGAYFAPRLFGSPFVKRVVRFLARF